MCDVEKYKKIYQEIAQLDLEDTLQLILEADTEEQREFYQVVGDFFASEKTERSNRKESFLMEKYILTDTVNGVHVSKDLQEVLTKAEDDVKNGRVAAIGKTFTELRNMLQEN